MLNSPLRNASDTERPAQISGVAGTIVSDSGPNTDDQGACPAAAAEKLSRVTNAPLDIPPDPAQNPGPAPAGPAPAGPAPAGPDPAGPAPAGPAPAGPDPAGPGSAGPVPATTWLISVGCSAASTSATCSSTPAIIRPIWSRGVSGGTM